MNHEYRRKRVQRTDNREKIKSVNREAVMLEQSEPRSTLMCISKKAGSANFLLSV